MVKHVPEPGEAERDTILVGVDGSPQSFGALMTAIDLARTFGKKVEAIAVYDPYLHYSVFNGIVNVLTEQAAKVFRFEEQNQLHEEIIDTGLAQIYQSHLEVGERMASEAGVEIKKTLLDGKPFQKIIDHARKTNPWLIVLGRIGVHSPKDETALGSNAENILRAAPCDVLLSTRLEVPRLDVRAEETVRWTPEAEARMTHVPEQVKGIARTGVLRLALEKGHSVITNAVIDEAMDRFMPKSASAATKALAEAVALERAKSGPVSMCRACGVTATQSGAVKCTVCGATDFEVISQEMIEKIAAVEGGLEEETTYDGRKLRWSEDARKGLWTMKNAYQRRRVKARVEKRARMKKLDAITLDFARQVIEEETGSAARDPGPVASLDAQASARGRSRRAAAQRGEARLIARDEKKNPLISTFDWTERRRAADPPGPGRVHAEQDAGADRGACAGARRGGDRSCARRGRHRDRQEDDGRDDRDLPDTGQGARQRRRRFQRPRRRGLGARLRKPKRGSERGPGRQRERLPQRGEPADRAEHVRRPSRGLIVAGSIVSSYRFCRTDDIGAARRRAESLLVSVLSRRAADDAGRVQAVDPRPSGLVQQLHGRLLGLRPDRRPDRRQAAFRYPRPQDRRPSRSSATGSWPSPAHLARLEARDSRPAANHRRGPRDVSPPACGLFSASGYVQEALLTDYVFSVTATSRRSERPGEPLARVDRVRDPCHGRRSRRQWSPWRGCIRRCAGSARSRPSPQGRTTSPDSPSPPTSESRPTSFT